MAEKTLAERIEVQRGRVADYQARADADPATLAELQAKLAKMIQTRQVNQALRQGKAAEIQAQKALSGAQLGYLGAQYDQQIGQARISQEGEVLQSDRGLEQAYRDWLASYGGRDMLRSGVYQAAVARGEEDFALQRAQIIREYNQTIAGLEAERMAGANQIALDRAAQIAQIKAAYAMARLRNLAG